VLNIKPGCQKYTFLYALLNLPLIQWVNALEGEPMMINYVSKITVNERDTLRVTAKAESLRLRQGRYASRNGYTAKSLLKFWLLYAV
jgi:hypothetical protein